MVLWFVVMISNVALETNGIQGSVNRYHFLYILISDGPQCQMLVNWLTPLSRVDATCIVTVSYRHDNYGYCGPTLLW
jgi:hypothetical protein